MPVSGIPGLTTAGTSAWPALLFVELTDRCNSRCVMCGRSAGVDTDQTDLPYDRAVAIAQGLFGHARVIDLRGIGETTLYRHFSEFLDYLLHNYPARTYKIITNGQRFPRGDMERFRSLEGHLRISFDSDDPSIYESIRRGSRFKNVVGTLRRWNRKARGERRAWLLVTVQRQNASTLASTVAFAAAEGAVGVSLIPVVSHPRDGFHLAPAEAAPRIAGAVQSALEAGLSVVFPRALLEAVSVPPGAVVVAASGCDAPWTTLLVKVNGCLAPCSHFTIPLGMLPRSGPVTPDIVQPQEFRMFREEFGKGLRRGPCRSCDRNALAYVGPRGRIDDPTWRFVQERWSPGHAWPGIDSGAV